MTRGRPGEGPALITPPPPRRRHSWDPYSRLRRRSGEWSNAGAVLGQHPNAPSLDKVDHERGRSQIGPGATCPDRALDWQRGPSADREWPVAAAAAKS